MRSEHRCEAIREELSAYLDGESTMIPRSDIEAHLSACRSCTEDLAAIAAVRRLVRVQAVEDVPDLARAIVARIGVQQPRRDMWVERARIGSVAAVAAALLILGASLPFDDTSRIAAASEVSDGVRAAAREIAAYRATFSMMERGWDEQVPERRMSAEIAFEGPENVRIDIRDHTDYPSDGWPRNDVTLIATADRSWISEPSSCPVEALPACAAPTTWAGVVERRSVVNRLPFDGTTALPTEIILPLETLAADEGFEVLAEETVSGRQALRLRLDYRQAIPLVASLQAGGSWRSYHPLDEVRLWVDRETWFPLRYEIRAGTSADRALWAQRHGLDDASGELLLRVQTTELAEPSTGNIGEPDVPVSGIRRDAGFIETTKLNRIPRLSAAGLAPYRMGRTPAGHRIVAFAQGLRYLKATWSRGRQLSSSAIRTAEEVALPGGGYAYYLPASATSGRRLEMIDPPRIGVLETNLPRRQLLDVAGTLSGFVGQRIAGSTEKTSGVTLVRTDPDEAFDVVDFARRPTFLPDAYEVRSAFTTSRPGGTRSLTVYLRRPEAEYEGAGIRIVQSRPIEFLPPSSEEFVVVNVGDVQARWSVERGELEWIEGGTYRAVAVPSSDLFTALQIAEGLR